MRQNVHIVLSLDNTLHQEFWKTFSSLKLEIKVHTNQQVSLQIKLTTFRTDKECRFLSRVPGAGGCCG